MCEYSKMNRARSNIKIDDVICLSNVYKYGDKVHARFVNSDNHTSFREIGTETVGRNFYFVNEETNQRFTITHAISEPSNTFISGISHCSVGFFSIINTVQSSDNENNIFNKILNLMLCDDVFTLRSTRHTSFTKWMQISQLYSYVADKNISYSAFKSFLKSSEAQGILELMIDTSKVRVNLDFLASAKNTKENHARNIFGAPNVSFSGTVIDCSIKYGIDNVIGILEKFKNDGHISIDIENVRSILK